MKKGMNPELQRYCWLEFTRHRLIAMPLVIGIILYMAGEASDYEAKTIAYAASTVFLLVAGLWGSHKVAEALTDEVNDNTWDFHRLSSLSPWTITWGKLIGGPIYCWYGGVMALLAYHIAALQVLDANTVWYNTLLMLGAVLIAHAVAFLSSVQAVQVKAAARGKLRVIGHQLAGLITGLYVLNLSVKWPSHHQVGGDSPIMEWYGQSFDKQGFILVFTAIFLAWFVAGAYWQMRAQLRMRTGPWLWTGFVTFMMVFIAGFSRGTYTDINIASYASLAAFITALSFLYVMVFLEPWNGVAYRRLLNNWKTANRLDFASAFPRWIATFGLTLAAAVLTMFSNLDKPHLVGLTVALTVFAIRDIALLHYFVLSPNNKRAFGASLFYLGIFYILLPVLFGILGMKSMVSLFLPLAEIDQRGGGIGVSMVSGLVQAAIWLALVKQRWGAHWKI